MRGNGRHPTNAGRVCVKGLYEHKILNDEDLCVGARGMYPMIREPDGAWREITWEQATAILGEKSSLRSIPRLVPIP